MRVFSHVCVGKRYQTTFYKSLILVELVEPGTIPEA